MTKDVDSVQFLMDISHINIPPEDFQEAFLGTSVYFKNDIIGKIVNLTSKKDKPFILVTVKHTEGSKDGLYDLNEAVNSIISLSFDADRVNLLTREDI